MNLLHRRPHPDGSFARVVSPNIPSGLHPSGYPTFKGPGGPGPLVLTNQSSAQLSSMYVKGSSLPGNSWETDAIYSNNEAYYLGDSPTPTVTSTPTAAEIARRYAALGGAPHTVPTAPAGHCAPARIAAEHLRYAVPPSSRGNAG